MRVAGADITASQSSARSSYRPIKQILDRLIALCVMPVVMVIGLGLLILNPFFNRGPLLFIQKRAGLEGKPFPMVKFRTMTPSNVAARDPNAKVEEDRITPLGRYLRQSRIDELPNFVNVLLGQMSMIGPRPDAMNHAEHFSKALPGYTKRFAVRPGITGLAQVSMGYAEGDDDTLQKIKIDQQYIQNLSFGQDARIVMRTIGVMATGFGSK